MLDDHFEILIWFVQQVHAEAEGYHEKLHVTCWKKHVRQDELMVAVDENQVSV